MLRILFFTVSLAFFGLSVQAVSAKRVALVIGNDRYEEVVDLQKAVNDANAISKVLAETGFTVFSVQNASRREMNLQIQQFTSQLEPGDEAMFFFAGHGVEIDGRNYLLPTDIPNAEPGKENFVKSEALAVDTILDDIRSKGTRLSLLVLDACRNNPFQTSGTRSLGGARGLARMSAAEGSFIMYSAGVGQTALDRMSDNDPNPNSVFTRSLIPLLKKPGLSLTETARQVRRDVQKLASTISHDQRPAYYDEVTGDFYFSGALDDNVPNVISETSQVQDVDSTASVDLAFWNSVKDSNDAAQLQEYLNIYPDGHFSTLARLRLEALQTAHNKEVAILAIPKAVIPKKPEIHECDRLAADPNDPNKVVEGVEDLSSNLYAALQACEKAKELFPDEARFSFQLARVLYKYDHVKEANELLHHAAESGYSQAMFWLGWAYRSGNFGLNFDKEKSQYWYKKAAESGNAEAMFMVSLYYRQHPNKEKFVKEKLHWLNKAINGGNGSAMLTKGIMYDRGIDFSQSDKQAAYWYQRAVDAGDSQAKGLLANFYDKGKGDLKRAPLTAAKLLFESGRHVPLEIWELNLHVDTIRALQSKLQEAGLYNGVIDGVYGEKMQKAIEALREF